MRIYFHTFGCKANQYDTEVVRQALESAGAVSVPTPDEADAAIVNSCTVTHVGEAKMRSLVRRLQRMQPDISTVVMGCAAAVDDGTIASLPGVTRVVAGSDPPGVLDALGLSTVIDPVLRKFGKASRAWLKVQDGCDEHCTFCATTLARGAHRSRRVEDVLEEATALAAHHEELVITGVHIGSYGKEWPGISLGGLMERLVVDVPSVRFRLSSVEANEIEDRVIDLMSSQPDRLAPHVHAPLQSGSDKVLKRMGRHWYTASTYRSRCESIAERVSAFGLGADVMVGFPGEAEEDHQATMDLVRTLPFTYLHVFPYSERPDTAARRLGTPIPSDVVSRRTAELRSLADQRARDYRNSKDGTTADIVMLDRHRGQFRGLTEDYLDVNVATGVHVPRRFYGQLQMDEVGKLVVSAVDCSSVTAQGAQREAHIH